MFPIVVALLLAFLGGIVLELQQAVDYCLSKRNSIKTYPFDETTMVFKIEIGNKMFGLLYNRQGDIGINLKIDPDLAEVLRHQYNGVLPAWHMNKRHWSTILFNEDVPDEEIYNLIDLSYDLVFESLTKKVQNSIME